MKIRSGWFVSIVVTGLLTVVSCGDNKTALQSVSTVTLSGRVGVLPDSIPPDMFIPLEPYSVLTGRPAYVEFEQVDSSEPGPHRTNVVTNLSSEYAAELYPGWYQVMVATAHTYPDIYDSLLIETDSTMNFVIELDFDKADSVGVVFDYIYGPGDPAISPLSPDMERKYLAYLNEGTGDMLDTSGMRTDGLIVLEPFHGYASIYVIPIREGYLTWEAYFAATRELLRSFSHTYPSAMHLYYDPGNNRLDPGDFWLYPGWLWPDSGKYTPPEPIINVWPDDTSFYDWPDSLWFRWNSDTL